MKIITLASEIPQIKFWQNVLLFLAFYLASIGSIFGQKADERKLELVVQTGSISGVESIVYTPDGNYLLSAGRDRNIKLWDVKKKSEVRLFGGHKAVVQKLEFNRDGSLFASSSFDGEIKVWDFKKAIEIFSFSSGEKGSLRIKFLENLSTLSIWAKDENTINYWNVLTGKLIRSEKLGSRNLDPFIKEEMTQDRKFKVIFDSGSDDYGKLDLWKENNLIFSDKVNGQIVSVAFSQDGKKIVAICNERKEETFNSKLYIWNTETGKKEQTIVVENEGIIAAGFSPDGNYLAGGGGLMQGNGIVISSDIMVWEIKTGKEKGRIKRKTESITELKYSSGLNTILANNGLGVTREWVLQKGVEINLRSVSEKSKLVYSPNGEFSAENNQGAIIIERKADKKKFSIKLACYFDECPLKFSNDSKYLIAGDQM